MKDLKALLPRAQGGVCHVVDLSARQLHTYTTHVKTYMERYGRATHVSVTRTPGSYGWDTIKAERRPNAYVWFRVPSDADPMQVGGAPTPKAYLRSR